MKVTVRLNCFAIVSMDLKRIVYEGGELILRGLHRAKMRKIGPENHDLNISSPEIGAETLSQIFKQLKEGPFIDLPVAYNQAVKNYGESLKKDMRF